MSVKSDLFLPGEFYHIFHQGNSGESIFKSDENFQFFLTKYSHYIFPVAETYSYCLMPNHFHLAIRLREEKELNAFFSRRSLELHPKQLPPQLKTRDEYSQSLSRLFSDFLNGYTQAFNKWHYRKGRLFSETLNRKKIDNMQYLINPIHYIHLNPVHHGFCKHPGDWIYSSFNSLLSTKANKVEIQKVMELFNGIKNFEVQQNRAIEMKYFLELEF